MKLIVAIFCQVKYVQKDIFYLITYMTEFLCAGNNTNEELRNAKSNQNVRGYTWSD